MVGATVDLHPALAKEIVQRGHESVWPRTNVAAQYSMTPEQERESHKQSVASIERATGTRPLGFNAFWLRAPRIRWRFSRSLALFITLTSEPG